jgi:uncharacterized repeat protein (TIGR03803 family)
MGTSTGQRKGPTTLERSLKSHRVARLQRYTPSAPKAGCPDGDGPVGLVQATNGYFYGATVHGGASGQGTIFRITLGGALTTLYSFCSQSGCPDGGGVAGLVQAANGNFYGTTIAGGAPCIANVAGCGTVFKITPSGTLTTLYSFCSQSGCPDGDSPQTGLVQATDGNFYGTTRGWRGQWLWDDLQNHPEWNADNPIQPPLWLRGARVVP